MEQVSNLLHQFYGQSREKHIAFQGEGSLVERFSRSIGVFRFPGCRLNNERRGTAVEFNDNVPWRFRGQRLINDSLKQYVVWNRMHF